MHTDAEVITLSCSNCERPLASVMEYETKSGEKVHIRAACCYGCMRDKTTPEFSFYQVVDKNFYVAGHGDLVNDVVLTELIDIKSYPDNKVEVFVSVK